MTSDDPCWVHDWRVINPTYKPEWICWTCGDKTDDPIQFQRQRRARLENHARKESSDQGREAQGTGGIYTEDILSLSGVPV